jgi:hypothetical protein
MTFARRFHVRVRRQLEVSAHALVALAVAASTAGCGNAAENGGSVAVQISGEAAATEGFSFPKGSDVTFADGWELHFSHVLVTVGDVTLSENPDKAPADQSQTDAAVARETGPWAVDLAMQGSVPAAGGQGTATPLTTIARENLDGNKPFAADRRYAFGYRIMPAETRAARVNFAADAATEALYARMISEGFTVLYAGTATFAGKDCVTSDAAYDVSALPAELPFELGFRTPTTYVNCQNQENQGTAFEGEEYQRGLAVLPNQPALAQITLHLEHPFFSDTVHDSSIYFDQLAARFDGAALTMNDLVGLDPTAFTDVHGAALPWRVCPSEAAPELPLGRQRSFGVGHTLVDPVGNPRDAFRDYRDFIAYVQSTQGHLNGGEGLCYVARDYPSPP